MGGMITFITALSTLLRIVSASNFTWSWPTSINQCDKADLLVYGGEAPWILILAPLYGMPVVWTVGDVGNVATPSAPQEFKVPVQLDPGTSYVAYMLDKGGAEYSYQSPTEIQTVGTSSDSTCMSGLIVASQEFYFNVGGEAAQCQNLQIYYSDSIGVGPYSLTVIPLDASYHPYDVVIGTNNPLAYNFGMQLTTGTRFTVMLNNANGYGIGGIGGIYEVAAGDNSCNILSGTATGTWPANLAPTSIGPLTASVPAITGTPVRPSSVSTSRPAVQPISVTASDGSSGPSASTSASAAPAARTNTALIGGAAGGGAAALALIGLLAFCWIKKRRGRSRNVTPVDLGEEQSQPIYEPKIEPYSPPLPSVGQTTAYGPSSSGSQGYMSPDRGSYMSPTSPSQGTYFLDSYDGHPGQHERGGPEMVYHSDGGSVSNPTPTRNSNRIEMPPSYGQASGKN